MKRLHLNTKDCSGRGLRILAKACGFQLFEGGNHTKVKGKTGATITTIPRHDKIKRETAKAIVEFMIAAGAKISFT